MEKVTQNKEINREIGKRVKNCRTEKGLTQEQLAEIVSSLPANNAIERSAAQIGYIERGQRKLSSEWAYLLSQVFNVRMDYLLCKDDFKTEQDREFLPVFEDACNKVRSISALKSFFENYSVKFTMLFDGKEASEYYGTKNLDDMTDDEFSRYSSFYSHLKEYKTEYRIERETEVIGTITEDEMLGFFDEIIDFIDFKFDRLIKGKERK